MKTAHHLSDITGYSLRSCEYWLSGNAVIPTDALVALLHSDRGKDFLAVAMADATPRWWLYVRAWIKHRSFAAQQRQHEREMRELLDENFPGPSAAALVHDPDFYEGLPSPARRQDRAVVRRKT